MHATIEFTTSGAIITENPEKKTLNGIWFGIDPNCTFTNDLTIKIGNKTFIDVTVIPVQHMEVSFGVPATKPSIEPIHNGAPIFKDISDTSSLPNNSNENTGESVCDTQPTDSHKFEEDTKDYSDCIPSQLKTQIQGSKIIEAPTTIIISSSYKCPDGANVLNSEESALALTLHYTAQEAADVISKFKNDDNMKSKINEMVNEYIELKDYSENSLLLIGYKYKNRSDEFNEFINPIIKN